MVYSDEQLLNSAKKNKLTKQMIINKIKQLSDEKNYHVAILEKEKDNFDNAAAFLKGTAQIKIEHANKNLPLLERTLKLLE